MKTSIFTKGKARPPMGTIKEVDCELAKELWDNTRGFRRTPSSLANIYNNKIKLNQITQRINADNVALRENLQKIESEYARKIDNHKSGIKYAKEVKDKEFRVKRSEIVRERKEALDETVKSLQDYEGEKRLSFEKEYRQGLEAYQSVISLAEKILRTHKMKLCSKDIKPKLNYKEYEVEELQETLEYLQEEIEHFEDDGKVVAKLWDKIKNLDDTETKTAAAAALVASVVATPLVAATAATTAVLSAKKGKETRDVIETLGVEVSYIWREAKKRYNSIKKNNTINLDEIQEEFQLRYKAIEDQHRLSLNALQKEEEEWILEYEAMKKDDRVAILQKEQKDKIAEMMERHKVQLQSKLQIQKEEEAAFNRSKIEFEKENQIPNMMSSFDSEIFQEIKALKEELQGYIKFRNLSRLTYNLDYSGVEEDQIAQSTYDKMLYGEEYLPLKKRIEENNAKGYTEEYIKEKYDKLCRKEDVLYILDTNKLHLGELVQEPKYESLGHIEQVLAGNFNNGSMLLVYKDQKEEQLLINYTKYLLQQMMAQMHPNALQINILNPSLDTAFNDIVIDTDTGDPNALKPQYVDTYINTDINVIKEEISRQIKERQYGDLAGGDTIVGVTRKKRLMASKTPTFYVNVLHRVDVGDELMLINENSSVLGVLNICLLDYKEVADTSQAKGKIKMDKSVKDLLSRNKTLIAVGDIQTTNEAIINIFDKETATYRQVKYQPMSRKVIDEGRNFYTQRFHKSLKNTVTTMVDEYIMQVVGDDLWSKSAEKTLELHFGYVDGDKSRPEPIVLNEETLAHGFVGGTTGGGKSVTLATVVNVMKALYPPSELEVIYYDFKQVEVALHAKPYKWANASALAGSSTAEYFISLLNVMTEEMDMRYADMKDAGVNKLSNYRKYLRNIKQDLIDQGEYERAALVEIPPRIVVIMDEVQEGFSIDSDTSETLKVALKKLSKVARAAGMHLILLSQNPDGVIPSDVLTLFTMRGSTKASPEVSKAILRNDFAARPENQYMGFFAVNTTPTGEEAGNVRFLVPFTPEPLSMLYSKISADMADKTEGETSRDAVVFDDDTIINYEMVDKLLIDYPVEPFELIIGDYVRYQKVFSPAKLVLEPDQAQNISFISSEKQFKMDFFTTIMKSINSTGNQAVVLFGKAYDPDYDVENLVEHHLMVRTVLTHAKTGKRLMTSEELTTVTPAEVEDGTYIETREPRRYYDVTDYKNKPRYGSDEEDESLVGIMTTTYEGLIQRQMKERQETGEFKPTYIIVVDPERDKYIIPERLWADKDFTALVNEACSVGIFTISITSNLQAITYRPWNKYVVAKKMGPDAMYEKEFKHIIPSLGRVRNMTDANESYTFKLPGKSGTNKKPWEI